MTSEERKSPAVAGLVLAAGRVCQKKAAVARHEGVAVGHELRLTAPGSLVAEGLPSSDALVNGSLGVLNLYSESLRSKALEHLFHYSAIYLPSNSTRPRITDLWFHFKRVAVSVLPHRS